MKKILIIRFSSIGDIVLTTPVIRCLKNQLPDAEIHYCVKRQYINVLEANPYIHKIHCLDDSVYKLASELRKEKFDQIIDLHNSLRSSLLKLLIFKTAYTFPKLNLKKWLLVNAKVNVLPDKHIVDRYFKAVLKLRIENDGKGLDYFIPADDKFSQSWLPERFHDGYIGFVTGGRHYTKIFPAAKVLEVCRLLKLPVVLLGGMEDHENAEIIARALPEKVLNACGKFSVNRSAAIVKQARLIITNDTGLMHIAAAFNKNMISLWGNTVPAFGMYPYLPVNSNAASVIFEVQGLSCRPCSKIGYGSCPEKHFDCMNKILTEEVARKANDLISDS